MCSKQTAQAAAQLNGKSKCHSNNLGTNFNLCPVVVLCFAYFRASFVTGMKNFEMAALEAKSQVAGVTLVIRGTGFTWGQLRAVRFDEMRTIVKLLQVVIQGDPSGQLKP